MRISGIYKIQSKIKTERIYIGSAININKRWWNHLSDLRKKRHTSRILQNHFNKYGEDDLQFSILLGCDIDDLIKIEQYFIDTYNPFFNVLKIAGRSGGMLGKHHSEKSKLKSRISHLGKILGKRKTKRLTPSWNKTPVSQYDVEGNFIRDWESAMDAKNNLRIDNIERCTNGQRKTAGGFIWKFKNVS